METNKKKIRLDEVTIMRTILAFLIVFIHAFTCYNHIWRAPEGFIDIPVYKWLARTSSAFTLEAFVFISGYLFAFQSITLEKKTSLGVLITNKLKRLMLPSIIFSAAYFAIFYQFKGVGNMVYSIINGCGHLWFLPMLFWCFIGGWLLEQIKIKDSWKLAFLVALNLFTYLPLALRLSNAFSFMVYFYGGFLCYKHSEKIKSYITIRNIIISWVVFAILFIVFRPLQDVLAFDPAYTRIKKVLFSIGNNTCQLLYAWAGLIAFFGTAVYYTQHHQLSKATVKISACCFGIYLFQQFVLQLLYYKTSLPLLVGPYWLPWCGFVVAALVSYLLSDLWLKTKVGKFLIG